MADAAMARERVTMMDWNCMLIELVGWIWKIGGGSLL